MEINEIVSLVFTVLSIVFYGIVFIPQFIKIYKINHSDGISIWTILLWSQADTLSLIGTIMLELHIGLVIIGWYHMLLGQLLLMYILIMKKDKNVKMQLFVGVFVISNFLISLFFQIYKTNIANIVIGQIIGWIASCTYIIGRFPQIYYNYKRKSVEGLSIYIYVFSICGNLCYVTSILSYSIESHNIIINLPWIFLTFFTGIFDIIVIYQSRKYKKETTQQDPEQQMQQDKYDEIV